MRSLQEREEREQADTEITLGMRSLLGIFFGLVLICGVFFGLGYSLGRGNSNSSAKSAPAAPSEAAKRTTRMPIGAPASEDDSSDTNTYTPGPDAREPITSSAAERST